MPGSLTDVSRLRLGHYTAPDRSTGCTVVLCEDGAIASASTRGTIIGSHEMDLVREGQQVQRVNAVVLVGRSALGLAAVAGVMQYLEERRAGFRMGRSGIRVPIVAAASVFDFVGHDSMVLDAATGYQACSDATTDAFQEGRVGVGSGARQGKSLGWPGTPAGIGLASRRVGEFTVGCLAVINSFAEVRRKEDIGTPRQVGQRDAEEVPPPGTNTSIAVVATDSPLGKPSARWLAEAGFAGFTAVMSPVSCADSFVIYVLSTSQETEEAPHVQAPRLETTVTELIAESAERAAKP